MRSEEWLVRRFQKVGGGFVRGNPGKVLGDSGPTLSRLMKWDVLDEFEKKKKAKNIQ